MDSIDLLRLKPLVFSEWYSWSNRYEAPHIKLPGVYLLARFLDSPPAGQADPACSDIVVIGETRRPLWDRLRDFDNAAFGGGGPHGVGIRYRRRQYLNALEALYVAILPSSPLDWGCWVSKSNEELACQLSKSSQNAVSAVDVIRFKRWFVQGASVKVKGQLNGAWIKFIERKLLLDYAILYGKLPDCNAE